MNFFRTPPPKKKNKAQVTVLFPPPEGPTKPTDVPVAIRKCIPFKTWIDGLTGHVGNSTGWNGWVGRAGKDLKRGLGEWMYLPLTPKF